MELTSSYSCCPVPNGKLVYDTDEKGNIVILDYISDSSILYLPDSLEQLVSGKKTGGKQKIANYIPDGAFLGCRNIKYVIVDRPNIRLGHRLFGNCSQFISIVHVDSKMKFAGDSIVNKKYAPQKIKGFQIVPDRYWIDYDFDHTANIPAGKALLSKILWECFCDQDCERLLKVVALESLGSSIRTAIEKNDVGHLQYMESLGIPIDPECPFVMELTQAIRSESWDVVDFFLAKKIFRGSYEDGSALYRAVCTGKVKLVSKLLHAGVSPFSESPEWSGSIPITEVAKDNKYYQIYRMLKDAQKAASSEAGH